MHTHRIRRAVRLYEQYKTETTEYKQIADSLGFNTGELNSHIWHLKHDKRNRELQAEIDRHRITY